MSIKGHNLFLNIHKTNRVVSLLMTLPLMTTIPQHIHFLTMTKMTITFIFNPGNGIKGHNQFFNITQYKDSCFPYKKFRQLFSLAFPQQMFLLVCLQHNHSLIYYNNINDPMIYFLLTMNYTQHPISIVTRAVSKT